MKYEKLINLLTALAVVCGAVMKVMHVEYANTVIIFGFIVMSAFQTWQVAELKKRIRELENK
jgi:hypothetical protein